jgi:hypothetical protein
VRRRRTRRKVAKRADTWPVTLKRCSFCRTPSGSRWAGRYCLPAVSRMRTTLAQRSQPGLTVFWRVPGSC